MKKRNQKKQIPLFYIIYLSALAAVILIIIAALGIVSARLSEYEAAQPKHVAAEIFDKYFTPEIDYSALLTDAVYDPGASTAAEITEHLKNEIGDSEITYSLGSSTSENIHTYIVKAGNIKFAAINVTEAEATTEHGYKTYVFDSLELYISTETAPETTEPAPTYTVTVHAPAGYNVTLGELTLTSDFVTETYTNEDALPHFPTDVKGLEFVTYKLTDLTEIPEAFSAADESGNTAEYDYDADALIYTVKVNYSTSLLDEHGQFVTDAITGYAAFMQADSSLSKIKKYFDTSSSLYDSIEAASKDLWMVKDHDGYDFTDIEIGEFYQLNDTTIVCHISFTHVLYMENKEDRPDVIDMYVFLHMTDDGYRIYEWYNT